jgi:hypothetical protein
MANSNRRQYPPTLIRAVKKLGIAAGIVALLSIIVGSVGDYWVGLAPTEPKAEAGYIYPVDVGKSPRTVTHYVTRFNYLLHKVTLPVMVASICASVVCGGVYFGVLRQSPWDS